MQCPTCEQPMSPRTVKGVTVDACAEGCGGLWFDRLELRRLDELREGDVSELLGLGSGPVPARAGRRTCPRCPQAWPLRSRLFHPTVKVEIDECPGCAGHFLDPGELHAIRAVNSSEAERERAARRIYAELYPTSRGRSPEVKKAEPAPAVGLFQGLFRALIPGD